MNEVIERPQANVEVQQTPMSIMALAIQQGASIESIERMWDLQVKYEERLAEKAFVSAMAEFKQNPPTILKEKHVKFGTTEYFHATHDAVTSAIIGGLSNHGISHRWDVDQKDGKIGVTCVLTHRGGHSQSTRLEAGYDTSGGKNSIQSIISAKTYLERHTLLSATGLSTRDIEDDDGRGADGPVMDANTRLELWSLRARAATTPSDLKTIQREANADFAGAKDLDGWNSFKAVYADCKATMQGGAA